MRTEQKLEVMEALGDLFASYQSETTVAACREIIDDAGFESAEDKQEFFTEVAVPQVVAGIDNGWQLTDLQTVREALGLPRQPVTFTITI